LSESTDELPDLGPLAGYSPLRRDENKPQGFQARGVLAGSVQAAGASPAAIEGPKPRDASQ
jgi:hypothetical protein